MAGWARRDGFHGDDLGGGPGGELGLMGDAASRAGVGDAGAGEAGRPAGRRGGVLW
jgi:hypothetical protein